MLVCVCFSLSEEERNNLSFILTHEASLIAGSKKEDSSGNHTSSETATVAAPYRKTENHVSLFLPQGRTKNPLIVLIKN